MSQVVANTSMSLDGFIEASDGSVEALFGWYSGGDEVTTMPGGDGREFRTSEASAAHLRAGLRPAAVRPDARLGAGGIPSAPRYSS